MPRRITHNEFVQKLKTVSPSISTIGKYQNSRTKLVVQCDICGYEWNARSSDLLRGHGCPRCSGKERKTTSRFQEEVANANANVEVLGEYVNTATKISVRCKICGNYWSANPSTLLNGIGCPSCGGTKKKSQDEFVQKLYALNSNIEVLGEYKNNRTKVTVKCTKCCHIWSATPHNLLDNRSRCPKCTHSSTSFMEQFIYEWLSKVLGVNSVIHRDVSAIGLELDVYVPSLKLAFEPGAWYWHKDKLESDELKRKRCAENGIRLITIYDKVPECELFSDRDVVLFPFDIRIQKKSDELEKTLVDILTKQGVSIDIHKIDIDEINNVAYKNSVKTDTDMFIEKLVDKGIEVEVLGTYKSSSQRINVRCKTCGHIWSPQADTLLSGNSSCRKCGIFKNGKAHLKKHMAFVSEVNCLNPTVEILGQYVKASERIHAKCRLCGYEWNPVANSLVRKKPTACPECGKKKMIETRMRNKLNKVN